MGDLSTALTQSSAGMRAQAKRLRIVSENIANADTPGYHRKILSLKTDRHHNTVDVSRTHLDRRRPEQIYAPGHPLADETGNYSGSNVDLIIETADAREAQRSYEANLKMFDQTRQMTQSLFDLLRR